MACAATRYFFISIRLSPTLRVTPLLSKYSSSGSAYFLLLPVASRTAASVMSPSIEEISLYRRNFIHEGRLYLREKKEAARHYRDALALAQV